MPARRNRGPPWPIHRIGSAVPTESAAARTMALGGKATVGAGRDRGSPKPCSSFAHKVHRGREEVPEPAQSVHTW
jgi:hypothetical protein